MSNEVFVCADLHLSHKKIIEFEAISRPFDTIIEHDAEIIRRWNDRVRKNDTVWVLGDVIFGKHNFPLLGRLNGIKKLVMGNHDTFPIADYCKYFSRVAGCIQYKQVLLSHIPIHPDQFRRYKLNIHGHLHSYRIMLPDSNEPDTRYVCVSMDRINLTPVLLNNLIEESLSAL